VFRMGGKKKADEVKGKEVQKFGDPKDLQWRRSPEGVGRQYGRADKASSDSLVVHGKTLQTKGQRQSDSSSEWGGKR